MSNGPTLRERMARIEMLLEGHIAQHEKRDRWVLRLLVGIFLLALPGCIKLLSGIGG